MKTKLIALTALALALRLINLGGPALWYDETGSVWMASLPFQGMIAATAGDTHPPLYLALLWVWVRLFGTGAAVVRLPSVALGVLCVPLAYVLATKLQLSRTTAFVAAFLVAVIPAQVHYSQEARMYALFEFEFLVTLIAVLDRRWWLYSLGLGSMLWTHNYGLLYAVPLALVGFKMVWDECIERHWAVLIAPPLVAWAWANLIALLSWLPWAFALAGQMREIGEGYWIQPVAPGAVLYAIYRWVWAFSTPQVLEVHTALLIFGAATWATIRAVRERADRAAAWSLPLIAFAPVALAVIASVLWKPILLPRGLLPSSILFYVWLAWAFIERVPLRRSLTVSLMVAPTVAVALVGYYLYNPVQKGEPQAWAAQIAWQPGDIVYHVNEGSVMSLRLYTPDEWPQYMMPATWRNLGALTDGTRAAMGFEIEPLESLRWRRAWVVWAAAPTVSQLEDLAVEQLLATYPHQTITEVDTAMTRQAIYLVFNTGQ